VNAERRPQLSEPVEVFVLCPNGEIVSDGCRGDDCVHCARTPSGSPRAGEQLTEPLGDVLVIGQRYKRACPVTFNSLASWLIAVRFPTSN
jgi:hypothetical protein